MILRDFKGFNLGYQRISRDFKKIPKILRDLDEFQGILNWNAKYFEGFHEIS